MESSACDIEEFQYRPDVADRDLASFRDKEILETLWPRGNTQ